MKEKIQIVLFVICLVFPLSAYNAVKMYNGESLEINSVEFQNDYFLVDNQKIPASEVSHINFDINTKEYKNQNQLSEDINKEELLSRAKEMSEKYSDASLLVLLDDGIQQLCSDNAQYSRSRYAVKICNESQLNLANLQFGSQEGRYDSRLIYARCISPEGREIFVDLNNVVYSTPSRGEEFFGNDKDNLKIMKYTIPEVTVGSIIDYEYESIDYSQEDPNQYYVRWWFNSSNPVYQSRLKVMIPQNKSYYFAEENIEAGKLIKKESVENGYRVFYFQYGSSDSILEEENGPDTYEIAAHIIGSPFRDQTYLSEWLAIFFRERMITNTEMETTVTSLLEGLENEEEKIAALYRFLQENIKYTSIKTSVSSNMAGHKATETFSNRYGDCIDKAILFATLLQFAGIEGYPVIVQTNDSSSPSYDKLGILAGNHAINEIHLKNGKIIYLDSTANNYRYPFFRDDDHGVAAWNPLKNSVRNTGYPSPSDESLTSELEIALKKNGSATVTETTILRGNLEIGYRYSFQNGSKDYINACLKSMVNNSFDSSHLLNYKIDDPKDESKDYQFQMNYTVKKLWNKLGNDFYSIYIRQPFGFEFITPEERKYEIRFDSVLTKIHKGKISIPLEMEIVSLPSPLLIESPYLNYHGTFRQDGKNIYYENTYCRKKAKIPAVDYSVFREALIQINDYINEPIILTKKKK